MDVLGIDLAKLTFDATLRTTSSTQHYHAFPNTPEGFAQLAAWLQQHGVTQLHACMEATNIYDTAGELLLVGNCRQQMALNHGTVGGDTPLARLSPPPRGATCFRI